MDGRWRSWEVTGQLVQHRQTASPFGCLRIKGLSLDGGCYDWARKHPPGVKFPGNSSGKQREGMLNGVSIFRRLIPHYKSSRKSLFGLSDPGRLCVEKGGAVDDPYEQCIWDTRTEGKTFQVMAATKSPLVYSELKLHFYKEEKTPGNIHRGKRFHLSPTLASSSTVIICWFPDKLQRERTQR